MSDERVEIEKISSPEIVQEEAQEYNPRYPGTVGTVGTASYGFTYGQEPDKVQMREIWRIIRRRKWMIATIALIVTTMVSIEMYRTRSVFEASTLVEVGKEKAVLNRPDAMGGYQDDYDPYFQINIKTKILILRSQALMEDVVVRHKLYNEPALLNSGGKKSMSEALQLIVSKFTGKNFEDPRVETVSLAPLENFQFTGSVEDSEKLRPYVGTVQGGLDIQQIKDTRAIRISYTHTDPKMAKLVADAVTDSFLKKNFENKVENYEKIAGWLETSKRELLAKVEQSDEALARYTRDHEIFSTDGKATLTTDKLARLHEQSIKAASDRMLKQSLLEEVKAGHVKELPEAFAELANGSGNKVGELQKQLSDLEAKKAGLDIKYGPDFPEVKEILQQIQAVKNQIAANTKTLEQSIQIAYERALREEQTINQNLERAKSEAVQQNQDYIQVNILKQDVETNKKLYQDFLDKTNQAKLQVAEQENNMRLIQGAQLPGAPSAPNRYRSIMSGFIISLIGGIALAFLLEYMDNTIKTVEDVTRYTQLPALSVIPATLTPASRLALVKKKGKALAGKKLEAVAGGNNLAMRSAKLTALDTRSSVAEAYRVLRTSVLLSTAGHAPKLILVTSGQPGEGKTTTTANTAVSLSQLGASVLVIDCDLRRPSIHKIFGVEHMTGLSTYLSRETELETLIQKTDIPNISVLPSGSIPPNPAELISSEKMKEMLQTLAARYDHILLDSPPLINVTDPVILSTMVDGVILVVQGNKTSREVVRRTRQELAAVGAKVFGVVLNNVDLRRDGYTDYYYYRYYSNYGKDEATGD
jgi:capsular exopolysaccharide synthesis family protein